MEAYGMLWAMSNTVGTSLNHSVPPSSDLPLKNRTVRLLQKTSVKVSAVKRLLSNR
ncbi:MAG: hypothetical protein AAFY26_08585 [Cyanobacteria bacterium J06638_22]